jgi:hypothetical protein
VADNVQAVYINEALQNVRVNGNEAPVRSQEVIYQNLVKQSL